VKRSSLSRLLLCTLFSANCGLCANNDFDDLLRAQYIHCAFFRNTGTLDTNQDERKAELLVHYQGIDRKHESARMISTSSTGVHEVRVVRTDNAVHFIEDASGLFNMTTVFGCNERDRRPGRHACITYGAVNLRLFDAAVPSQPDKIFESYRDLANHGFCDYSFFGDK